MLAELCKTAAEQWEIPEAVTLDRWTIHDLRRTARSLMTQAGIAPDHAERALGHVISGIRGVYFPTRRKNRMNSMGAYRRSPLQGGSRDTSSCCCCCDAWVWLWRQIELELFDQ